MANTYTQLYVQFVFAVKNRQALIPKDRKEEIHKYIGGIIKKRGLKPLSINSMPDHIHIFLGYKPDIVLSDLVRDIKVASSLFIKENKITPFKFEWQHGFGAFTYSKSQVSRVCNYIENQEEHHKKKTFREEYLDLLQKFEIEYQDKYLFDFIDY